MTALDTTPPASSGPDTAGSDSSGSRATESVTTGDAAEVGPAAPPAGGDDRRAWRRALVTGGVAYLLSRAMVVAGASILAAQKAGDAFARGAATPASARSTIVGVLVSWDAEWYMRIVRNGYPSVLPNDLSTAFEEARAGFFPLYPMLVTATDRVLPGSEVFAALLVNLILGALVVYLVGVLARDLYGTLAAERSMILMALFPGSFVLSFAYSEALLIALAAGTLIALQRRQWLLAGVVAALATATRPNGLAVAAACGVAAVVAIRERREWRSLVAPALAPLGVIAFHVYLRIQTGEDWVWFRMQSEVWGERMSFGAATMSEVGRFLTHPGTSTQEALATATVFGTAALLLVAWKKRMPWPMVAYVAVVVVLMLLPDTVTARPRFLYTAFPLLVVLGAWWPDDRDRAWARQGWSFLMAVSGAGLVFLTAVYGAHNPIP